MQTLGTQSAREDMKALKSVVLEQPLPSVEVLNGGLEILRTEDLREELKMLRCPFIRFYGYLDGLVPRKVAGLALNGRADARLISHQLNMPEPLVQAMLERLTL